MPWKLRVENIGGLLGTHEFIFKDGINIINAPNASGKTSLLNALRLISAGEDWSDEEVGAILNRYKDQGYVKLENEVVHEVTLIRSNERVSFLTQDIRYSDKRTRDLVFLMPENILMSAIREADINKIERWFKRITNIEYYESLKQITRSLFDEYQAEKKEIEERFIGKEKQVQETLNERQEELERTKSEIIKILTSKEFVQFEEKKNELEKQRRKLIQSRSSSRDKKNQLQAELTQIENDITTKEKKLSDMKGKLKDLKEDYNFGIVKLEEWNKEISNFQNKINETEKRIDAIKVFREKNLDELAKRSKLLLLDGKTILKNCPYCDNKINEDWIKNRIDELRDENEELIIEFSKINEEKSQHKTIITEIENEMKKINEVLPVEIKEQEKRISNLNKSITKLNKSIVKNKRDIADLDDEIKELTRRIVDLNHELEKLVGKELQSKLKKLHGAQETLEKQISNLEGTLEEIKRGTLELRKLRKKVVLSKQILDHFTEKIERIRNERRMELNRCLKESFELLELAKVDKLQFDDNFRLEITREGGYVTYLQEMSGAEKTTIALLVLYEAKQMILPDFPFFVVDEVSEAMDDTRFLRIVEYISERLPMVIITRNKPLEGEPELLSQKHIVHGISILA